MAYMDRHVGVRRDCGRQGKGRWRKERHFGGQNAPRSVGGKDSSGYDAYMTGKAIIGHDCGVAWCYNELLLATCFALHSTEIFCNSTIIDIFNFRTVRERLVCLLL